MGAKLPPDQLRLYKRIDEILWHDWDPIGVNDCEDARDEYHRYLPHIFRLALEGKDADRIALSLVSTIESSMGLSANKDHNLTVAKIIIQAKEKNIGKN